MPWVRFTHDFNWLVPERHGRVSISYRAGMERLVRTHCAEAAISAGRAERIDKPHPRNGPREDKAPADWRKLPWNALHPGGPSLRAGASRIAGRAIRTRAEAEAIMEAATMEAFENGEASD